MFFWPQPYSVFCSIVPCLPQEPQGKWRFWHYASAQWQDESVWFPLEEFLFPTQDTPVCVCVLSSLRRWWSRGRRKTFPVFHLFECYKMPWFNHTSFRVIKTAGYFANSWNSCSVFLYLLGIVPSLSFNVPRTFFINRNCQTLANSKSRYIWYVAKNIPNNFTSSFLPLLNPDGTIATTSISKAGLFPQTSSDYSTLTI